MGKLLLLCSVSLMLGMAHGQAQPFEPPGFGPWALPGRPGQMPPPPPTPPPGAQDMPHILNDTPEYCDELRDDIVRLRARRGEMPPDAAILAREGERLCRIGHIRPGIFRLRTALMILRHSQ